ncbi:hypothetical protein, partial [Neisseria meningitidis serogroup B]
VGVKYYRGRGIGRKCRLSGAAWKKIPPRFSGSGVWALIICSIHSPNIAKFR